MALSVGSSYHSNLLLPLVSSRTPAAAVRSSCLDRVDAMILVSYELEHDLQTIRTTDENEETVSVAVLGM